MRLLCRRLVQPARNANVANGKPITVVIGVGAIERNNHNPPAMRLTMAQVRTEGKSEPFIDERLSRVASDRSQYFRTSALYVSGSRFCMVWNSSRRWRTSLRSMRATQ